MQHISLGQTQGNGKARLTHFWQSAMTTCRTNNSGEKQTTNTPYSSLGAQLKDLTISAVVIDILLLGREPALDIRRI